MYHRVLPRSEAEALAVEPGMYVTPETFRRHLAWLGEDFHVLSLDEIVARLEGGQSLPDGACALTFDDGWKDNLDHALPALEQHAMPATVFLVHDRVGTQGAFWPDEVCRRMTPLEPSEAEAVAESLGAARGGEPIEATLTVLKALSEEARPAALARLRERTDAPATASRELLDWDEVDRMARAGVDFESHGTSHAILTGLDSESAAHELRASLERLRERGHARHGLLAYPSGGQDERVRRLAREAGYRAAVTTEPGLACGDDETLALPRLGLHEDVSGTRAEFRRIVPGQGLR